MRNALAKAGTTSREFLLMSGALFNAGMTIAMPESDNASPRSAAQKANVALLQKNHAEWKKMEQEIVQLATQAESKPKR